MATDPNRKLTSEEVAKRTGLKHGLLRKLRSMGGGPPYFKIGHTVLYALADVDAWIESKRVTETDKTGRAKRPASQAARAAGAQRAHA